MLDIYTRKIYTVGLLISNVAIRTDR